MSSGRITFRKGGHPSAFAQPIRPGKLFDGQSEIEAAWTAAYAEIESARKRRRRPILTSAEKARIEADLRQIALLHRGMHDAFASDASAQDVRGTLRALARIADKESFEAALRDCDAMTHDRFALAVWKMHRREGMRTPREVIDAIEIAGLQQAAHAAAKAMAPRGGRPVAEHHHVAIRTLARTWETFAGTKASAGSGSKSGPFPRFLEAVQTATGAAFPVSRDAVERALRRP